ncbi:hypothetical protein [Calothrix sp. NIES-2098]|uniref:hypothetical protein n=1 Tax=Calothrix sp. NIES-2098 TaxID=1954171 RepID=UPI0030D7C2E4
MPSSQRGAIAFQIEELQEDSAAIPEAVARGRVWGRLKERSLRRVPKGRKRCAAAYGRSHYSRNHTPSPQRDHSFLLIRRR